MADMVMGMVTCMRTIEFYGKLFFDAFFERLACADAQHALSEAVLVGPCIIPESCLEWSRFPSQPLFI